MRCLGRQVPNDIRQTSNDIGKIRVIVNPHTKKNVAGKKNLIPGLSLHPYIVISKFYCKGITQGIQFSYFDYIQSTYSAMIIIPVI